MRPISDLTPLFLASALLGSSAWAGPAPRTGNSGLPNALAEIQALTVELTATRSELAATQAELTLTESALDATVIELSLTKDVLADTEDALEAEQQRYRVPRTGQKSCWQAATLDPEDAHDTVPCAGTGQDGDSRAGLAPPANRFIDNGDGTITDSFTRLVWTIRADCGDELSWDQAVDLAGRLNGQANTNLCSLRDGSTAGAWRLPNVNELLSLVDFEAPFEELDGFIGGADGYFWSSTTFALPPDFNMNGLVYSCQSRGYGLNMPVRFNDAYAVRVDSGEIHRVPCVIDGFKNGTPDLNGWRGPRFLAVRNPSGPSK